MFLRGPFRKSKNAPNKKFLLAFLSLFFCLYFVPLATAEVVIPQDLAMVRDRSEGKNGKSIVVVEEAHVQYAAQKALANLLQDLVENGSFRYVFVEGGWGNVSLAKLRSLTDLSRRGEIAERYLREGKISGEEYLDLSTDLDMHLWGVEDPKLYEANMKVFLSISEAQPGLLAAVGTLETETKALRTGLLTPAMNEVLDKRQALDDQKITLLDYALFLSKALPDEGVRYPHLVQLATLSGGNGFYDPDKVAFEKESAVRFLSNRLTKPELEAILALGGEKTAEQGVCFLEALLAKTASFPEARKELSLQNLRSYRDLLQKTVGMDSSVLQDEIEKAGREVLLSLNPSQKQQEFLGVLQGIRFLKKLFNLTLGLNEFQRASSHDFEFDLVAWDSFLKTQCAKNSIPYVSFDGAVFAKYIPEARTFYETAIAREAAMVKNAVVLIEGAGLRRAVFVMGGFHSRAIFKALKERGYGVTLVSPRFNPENDQTAHDQYLNVLKYKWTGRSESAGPELKSQSAKITGLDPKQV